MTTVIQAGVARRLGLPLPRRRAKFMSSWTYYDHFPPHTTGRDCPVANPLICPICSDPLVKADRANWYQSRTEANFAVYLTELQRQGMVKHWQRGKSVIVLDTSRAKDRLRYTPDFLVTFNPPINQPDGPDLAYEAKGALGMMDPSSKMRIKMYRGLAARGLAPPLKVMCPDRKGGWKEIFA